MVYLEGKVVLSICGRTDILGLFKNFVGRLNTRRYCDKLLWPIEAGIHPASKWGFFNKTKRSVPAMMTQSSAPTFMSGV